MPNKFITNLDLARQAEIFSGETAVFQGGMQLGIPFSGFPSGVDTSTITSIGVVDTQFAAFSGDTGTTVFNVTDPSSPYYNATATTLTTSPYTVIDNDTITETVSATTYPTIMSFTALSGTSDAPLSISFTPPVIQELYDRGLYGTLFDGLGLTFLGQTYSDESFYNDGSIFSGANLNMEIVEYAPHGATPAWVTGTTSGTVIEYSALTQYWTDPTIINGVSGLTLPITPESAETKTIDYVWTLTDTTIIDENVVGLKYTGYSVTYSFNDVIIDPESPSAIGATGATSADTYYLGTVTASLENFSAGTLDYKGSTNWITIDGRATVAERLTVDRLTINNPGTGSPINNIGITADGDVVFGTTGATVTGLTFNDFTYDLTVGLDNGLSFTDNLGILASDIKVTGGTFDDVAGEITFVNNSGGTFVVSGLTTEFTGNTSGTCITDLHITNLHSCSPLYVNPLDEGNVYFGSTSGVTIDVANNRMGIGTQTPSTQLHIAGSGANIRVQSTDTSNASLYFDTQTTGGGTGFRNTAIQFQENSTTQWMIGMNGLAGGSEEDKQFVIANNTSFDNDNILNINPSNGYVGLGVQAPTERLDVGGNIKISDTYANITTELSTTGVNTLTLSGVSSQLSELKVTSTNSEFLSFGVRGSTEASFPTYGKNGDNYIYSSTNSNGLNLISSPGVGTEDYIRFYAGQYASGSADIHIQGSGSTKGYVGIGTETPTEKLDVSGNVKISGEINLSTLGTGTSVNNLGIDASGNVVSAISATVFWKYGTDGTESLLPNYTGTTSDAKGDYSAVFGGQNNVVETGSTSSSIIGGNDNTIDDSFYSTIMGGSGNTLTWGYSISPSSNGGRNAIISSENSLLSGNTTNTVILGGQNNSVYDPLGTIFTQSLDSAIIGGNDNVLNVVDDCVIVGGQFNVMSGSNHYSCVIVGGSENTIENTSNRSFIIGGTSNDINGVDYGGIIGGENNIGIGYTSSVLIGGSGNTINSSDYGSIIGGRNNDIIIGEYNVIAGGRDNVGGISGGDRQFIGGGSGNTLSNASNDSAIIASKGSEIFGANSSAIIGGENHFIDTSGNHNVIIGGEDNNIASLVDRSVIIGGQGITATTDDTVYVPDLLVNGDADFAGATLQTGVNLYGTSTFAINLTNKSIVRFELNGTITGPSIGAGSAGQRVILYVEAVATAGTTTISVPGGLGFTQIVFSSLADSVEMIYDSGNWVVLSSRGATIS
jgi:hypothetical protein